MAAKPKVSLLFVFRLLWWLLALVLWGYWLASIPVFLERVEAGTLPVTSSGELSPAEEAAAGVAAWGVPAETWARIHLVLNGISYFVACLIGAIIIWRVRTGFGVLTAFVLLVTGGAVMSTVILSTETTPFLLFVWQVSSLVWVLFFPWLYLFPDGRPIPARLLWLFVPLMIAYAVPFVFYVIVSSFPPLSPIAEQMDAYLPLIQFLILVLFALAVGAQIYRYFKISNPIERVQTRWFVFTLAFVVLGVLLTDLLGWQLPTEVGNLLFALIPIGIGISILRYRLWDVDVIIRRTLVYGSLTLLLALVYFGSVVLLQQLFGALTGQEDSPLAVVISTLAIAALFNPLRLRLQAFIDRRFYRRKYNAELTLSDFSTRARSETDLAELSGLLTRAATETFQPAYTSLWLTDPETIKLKFPHEHTSRDIT